MVPSAVAGAGIAILVILIVQGHIGTAGTRQGEPYSPVAEPLAGELAERFRPRLLFDSREKWRPLDVEAMLDEGTQRFCTRLARASTCVPIRNAAEFDALVAGKQAGAATYLDINGDKTDGYRGPVTCRPLLDCDRGARSAIYYHASESNGRYYLDYWWFLRFNHFAGSIPGLSCTAPFAREAGICDEHEGDWEGVTVVTRPGDDRSIEYVVCAAHKGTFRYSGAQLELRHGRPAVYLAEGSHAAYPLLCARDCHQPAGLALDGIVELPESPYDGRASWGRNGEACVANAPGSCLLSLDRQSWTHWAGQWGAGCAAACHGAVDADSPRSPGVQARFQTPWCSSQNGVFTCDGRSQRCADWLGSQVLAVACDPIVLTESQRSGTKLRAGGLGLEVGGTAIRNASTPGVVQALGVPLEPGETLKAIVDGPNAEVIVRAAQGAVVSTDRFASDGWSDGESVGVTVSSGPDGPRVLANGRAPVERTLTERPTPAALGRALQPIARR